MKNICYILLIFTSISFVLSACKKSNNQTKTTTTYITEKSWIITKYRIRFGNANEDWKIGSIAQCNVDDIYSFNINNSFMIGEGLQACNPNNRLEQQGSWNLLSNDKSITVSGTHFHGTYTLKQIDDKQLILVDENVVLGQEFTFIHP